MSSRPSHRAAIAQAVLVTFLWSSSWVLIKFGLRENLPALTFAGLRYALGFACLAPLVLLNPHHRATLKSLARSQWLELALLGLVMYTLTQGAQFLSLGFLPAAMVTLLLNLTPVVVGLAGAVLLREHPARGQWFGIALCIGGVAFYFLPLDLPASQTFGLAIAVGGVLANAGASLLGRRANRHRAGAALSPLVITFVSMGVGAGALLVSGVLTQGIGALTTTQWLIIAWLGIVNTAFAFTLWNHTLRTLSAVESSVLNGLMLPQIAVLAVVFLGEPLTPKAVAGLALVGVGTLIVQLKRGQPRLQ